MRLLLDSHVFLWWRGNDPRVHGTVAEVISGADDVFVSAVSAWELGLKAALGKLTLPTPIEDGVRASGFRELPVTFRHTERATKLPLIHKDPFDRLLIAQALCEGLTLVTHDEAVGRYDVPMLRIP